MLVLSSSLLLYSRRSPSLHNVEERSLSAILRSHLQVLRYLLLESCLRANILKSIYTMIREPSRITTRLSPSIQKNPHSIGFSGKGYHRSSKASRRKDLQVEEPVACGNCASFPLPRHIGRHAWPDADRGPGCRGVPAPVRNACWLPFGMMEAFHREQLPLDGVMGLIQQRAGHRHLGVCEHGIPARLGG